MQAAPLRCTSRLLSRGLPSSRYRLHDTSVVAQQGLHTYPIFNLNDVSDRSLGPRPGDEAILTLSGGVDSSVAAYLALEKGGLIPHKTIFMRNWNSLEESEGFEPGSGGSVGCQWKKDWDKVVATAKCLDVEAQLMDLSGSYWNSVFSPSLDEWSRGWTPNPDILCNREIKFGELLRRLDQPNEDAASDAGAYGRHRPKRWLVTGHYAGLQYFYPLGMSMKGQLHGRLLRASDATKDQSYFLSAVPSQQLGRTHFPLSNMTKMEVRQLAKRLGLPTSDSEESMGLCFVGERKGSASKSRQSRDKAGNGGFGGFLNDYIEPRTGNIVDTLGRTIGKHSGLHTVTIGQGAKIGGVKERLFVAAKDAHTNTIIAVPGSDHPWLQCRQIKIDSFTFINAEDAPKLQAGNISAQIRHRQAAIPCRVAVSGASVNVYFDKPVLAVAEGQVCAFYQNDECLGSGIISEVKTAASSQASQSSTWASLSPSPSSLTAQSSDTCIN